MPNLRAVASDEKPQPRVHLTVAQAIESGDPRKILVAMRDRVAKVLDDPNCPPRDLASNTRRVQELNRDIDALDARVEQEASENATVPDEEWDAASL